MSISAHADASYIENPEPLCKESNGGVVPYTQGGEGGVIPSLESLYGIEGFKGRFEDWKAGQVEAAKCTNLEGLLNVYQKWLYLEPGDIPFIEVVLAATLDREIPGDPVWLYAVAPSGGIKSELIRTLGQAYGKAYTLDSLTPATFVSGLAEKDPDSGEWVPVAGLLQDLDGKCLLIKDFTTILTQNENVRNEIYGQLRSIYDGFFEKPFGTMRRKVSVKASIGLVVGVTPAIDRYTKMASALGERFLKIRNSPDRLKASAKALSNEGKEIQMRLELVDATKTFLSSLDFSRVPEPTPTQTLWLLKLAYYTAYMRSNVWASYDESGRVVDAEVGSTEIPTRIAKQFKHLLKLLAIVRGHAQITNADLLTIQRVAKDTAEPKKQSIMDFVATRSGEWWEQGDLVKSVEGLYRQNAPNHLQIMESLGILESGDGGKWRVEKDFKEFVDTAYNLPESNQQTLDFVSAGAESIKSITAEKPGGEPFQISYQDLSGSTTHEDPEERLIRVAAEYIESQGFSVGKQLFFDFMWGRGFKGEDLVKKALAPLPGWRFSPLSVSYEQIGVS